MLDATLIPGRDLGEREMLLAYLARQRELVLWKCAGLSDEAARAQTTPSGLTIHGIVRHLENVERSWWRERFGAQQGLSFDWTDEDPDGEFHVPDDVRLSDVLAAYRAEIALCDEVIGAYQLDDLRCPKPVSLRWLLLHLIEEIGRHLGHLDLLCERADGRTGEEPDDAPAPGVDG